MTAIVVIDQRRAGFGAALVGLLAAHRLLVVSPFQRVRIRHLGMLRLVCGEALAATFQALAATGEGFGIVLQRSEEHTSELQSRENIVCRLLLEKKKNILSNVT